MAKRLHVLFVCLGNICRSAMAEAMARKYGSDVLRPASAGLTPASTAHPTTRAVLEERNIDPGHHVPRHLADVDLTRFDLIVNISGRDLGIDTEIPTETWNVKDPIGRPEEEFRQTREELEMLVMRLILRARLGKITPLPKNGPAIDAGQDGSRQ